MSETGIFGDISFVIAVVGHRDLYEEDEEEIKAAIEDFLKKQREGRSGASLLLITGMAEGADCLAAEVAHKMGISFVAALPFDEDAYYDTFSSTSRAGHARELVKHAKHKIVLPRTKENQAADLRDQVAQDRQYEALASFLVEASQILLAIYDSQSESLQGGTGDAIQYKLGTKPNPHLEDCSALNSEGVGPVYYIQVRRTKYPSENPPVSSDRLPEYPNYRRDASEKGYAKSYKLLDEFNCEVTRGKLLLPKVANSRSQLYPGIKFDKHPTPAMTWAADRYAWADAFASRFQAIAAIYWDLVFFLLAVAAAALLTVHVIPRLEHSVPLLLLYYASVILALILGVIALKSDYRRKHEEYRSLAEALRIQYIWLVSGLNKIVAEFYLNKQAGELAWVRDAMSEVVIMKALSHSPAGNQIEQANLSLVLSWTNDQKGFFEKGRKRNQLRWRICNGLATVIFLVAFFMQIGMTLVYHFKHMDHPEIVVRLISGILIAWAALARAYGELNNYSQLATQYEAMENLFSVADDLLKQDQKQNCPAAREHAWHVVNELGKAALQESGDWMLMHRERQLHILLGGS